MTITHKFSIGSDVYIPAIESPARVRQIRIDLSGISYLLTYWVDSKLNEVWLSEDELAVSK